MTPAWEGLQQDFSISLEAERKSASTLRIYLTAVKQLAEWGQEHDGPDAPRDMT
jgi:hypothetical protein